MKWPGLGLVFQQENELGQKNHQALPSLVIRLMKLAFYGCIVHGMVLAQL